MNAQLIKILSSQKEVRDSLAKDKFYPRLKTQKLDEVFGSSLIKIITGPRRAGKSTLLFLLLKKMDFIYVNFDDNSLLREFSNEEDFLDCLKYVYGDTKIIFFDEIQNFPNWELFLNKLHRNNYNIFITGSNAKLLSGELATSLTGRFISLEVYPFSFQEYLGTLNKTDLTPAELFSSQNSFLYKGGFPEILLNMQNTNFCNEYIELLVWSILHKDISLRYKIKNISYVNKLVDYLIANNTNKLNYKTISSILGIKTYRTVIKYLEYIDNSYLFYFLSGFSFKAKKRISSNNKIYVIDNAVLSYRNLYNTFSKGVLFENLIFTELIKKDFKPNYNLFYYKTENNYEVDFIIKENTYQPPKVLIQVCYDVSSEKTKKREVRALLEASKELKCDKLIVLTFNHEEDLFVADKTIKFIPFSVFYKNDFKF